MAKSFLELIKKYNPYHDSRGRFTSPNGGGVSSFSLPKDPKYREKWKEKEGKRVADQESGKVTLSTGYAFNLPKLEGQNADAATSERTAAIKRADEHRSKIAGGIDNKANDAYNKKLEAWAAENTDSNYWMGIKNYGPNRTFKEVVMYKPKAEKEKEAQSRKERESRDRAYQRAAEKRTPKYQELQAFEDKLREKYSDQIGRTARSIFQVMSAEEGKQWDALRNATIQRQSNGQYRIAKSFREAFEKFNPYHDRLGRFTSANSGNVASFTYKPGASRAHDLAIAREKERTAAADEAKNPNAQDYEAARQKIKDLNAEYKRIPGQKAIYLRESEILYREGDKKAADETMGKYHELDKRSNTIREEISETAKSVGVESAVGMQLLGSDIEYRKVKQLDKPLDSDEIIRRLGGGDLTKGSCSSLAFAYAGNENGLDVLDFRGGESQSVFSRNGNIYQIANLPGVKSTTASHTSDFRSASAVLKNVESGKNYYLATGRHAAIVRKNGDSLEYLELQSSTNNGFKPLTNESLKNRFGAQRSHSFAGSKFEARSVLIEVESLKGNKEFEQMLGYINTSGNAQMKGASGHER